MESASGSPSFLKNMLKRKVSLKIVLLIILFFVSVFFRFWQIRDYVVFLGDEGRDMIVMRNIFVNGDIPFLGPSASVGGFYLGPVYYWMAAPFLWLSNFDPVGPAYFVAMVRVLTVFLLFKFLKDTVGLWPAFFASILYATAPLIVRYSRSSWNPNVLPFFALLMIYFIYLGISKRKFLNFLFAGAAFGISIQLHYLAVILAVIGALIVFSNVNFKKWPSVFLLSLLGALITFSPFFIFELRHQFPNFKTILEFVGRGSNIGYKSANLIFLISDIGNIFLEEISLIMETFYTKIAFWILAGGSIWVTIKNWKEHQKRLISLVAIIWFIGGLIGLRFYTGQIYDYYFGFMFPAPFFLGGLIFYQLWQTKLTKAVVVFTFVVLLFVFLGNGFYKSSPNKLIDQTAQIANFIIEKTNGDSYNFALISESNSDHAYRYFLETRMRPPIDLEEEVTNQLLVVCESKKCEPLGHPNWEIAGFGRAQIEGEWSLEKFGIKVFKLIHLSGQPSPAGKPAIKGG